MFRQAFVLLALVALAIASPVPNVYPSVFMGRIVGGSNAVLGQFPYQVSLRNNNNAHFCGGSIITNRWALSAAHCTVGRGQTAVRVVVGTIFLNSGGVAHQSSSIVNHPQYNSQTIANDISVVQTAVAITMNANVQIIALGGAATVGAVPAVFSGWGTTVNGGSAPNNLQWMNTNTLTNADCRSRHSIGNAAFVFDSKICAFSRNGQGMCHGDSGGPLVAGNAVIGTASWVIPCGVGFPDAYDRVSWFRNWILSVIS